MLTSPASSPAGITTTNTGTRARPGSLRTVAMSALVKVSNHPWLGILIFFLILSLKGLYPSLSVAGQK